MLKNDMDASKEINKFEVLFNNATMGIVIVDSKGLINSVNPYALNLFGYALNELIAKPIEILIPSRFQPNHKNLREGYTQNPKNRPMGEGVNLFATRKDQTEFPVEISLGNFITNNEKNVIAFISDISKRKKAENEIIKLNEALEKKIEERTKALNETLVHLESLLHFQKALLDNAGALIISTNENGIINLFNKEASLNIGYSPDELIGKHKPVLFHHKAEIELKRIELKNLFNITIENDFDVLVEKARRNIHNEEEYTYISKEGKPFPVSLTITSIRDINQKIIGFIGIAIDITERKKMEESLRDSLEKEKELGELKSRFVSMASHEFRTPLSTILSSAYLIEKYLTTEDQIKREKHLNRIISSVNMLTDILNDFLSVGKIEEGKIQVRLSEFNIQETISNTINEIENNLKNGQKVIYKHEGDLIVALDISLLKHIVMNLISNASKFSNENSAIEITTFHNDNNELILTVKDHGIGISKSDQIHLMERFFRGENAGNIQGTGLGLHIVSKYAELMNGVVECKSEIEKGTEFMITFTKN